MASNNEPLTFKLLRLIAEKATEGTILTAKFAKAFLLSAGSVKLLARNVGMIEGRYYSTMQSLQKNGFIKKTNENQFLVTPKGLRRIKIESLLASLSSSRKVKKISAWYLVIFDIPDDYRRERNVFRSALKRHGFIGIQKSVYISPSADFKKLSQLRNEFGIARYITFLNANIAGTDDDKKLLKRFGVGRIT